MKLRDIYRIYKGYQITLFGRPLDEPTIPFTFLPKNKDRMDCDVVDYKVIRKERDIPHFDLSGKYKFSEHTLGDVYVYIK